MPFATIGSPVPAARELLFTKTPSVQLIAPIISKLYNVPGVLPIPTLPSPFIESLSSVVASPATEPTKNPNLLSAC